MSKVKFKIFNGPGYYDAAEYANEWLKENPDVEILEFSYSSHGENAQSICIMYKRKDET